MRYRLRLILLFNYHESVSKLHEEPNKCYQYNNYLLNVFLLNFSTKCKIHRFILHQIDFCGQIPLDFYDYH